MPHIKKAKNINVLETSKEAVFKNSGHSDDRGSRGY